jgi:hypothetical protein
MRSRWKPLNRNRATPGVGHRQAAHQLLRKMPTCIVQIDCNEMASRDRHLDRDVGRSARGGDAQGRLRRPCSRQLHVGMHRASITPCITQCSGISVQPSSDLYIRQTLNSPRYQIGEGQQFINQMMRSRNETFPSFSKDLRSVPTRPNDVRTIARNHLRQLGQRSEAKRSQEGLDLERDRRTLRISRSLLLQNESQRRLNPGVYVPNRQ